MGRVTAAVLAMAAFVAPAAAQELDFGVWCSDIARFDADRCAEERPEDKSAYERYAAAPADVLKVAHHGSAASSGGMVGHISPEDLLKTIKRKPANKPH